MYVFTPKCSLNTSSSSLFLFALTDQTTRMGERKAFVFGSIENEEKRRKNNDDELKSHETHMRISKRTKRRKKRLFSNQRSYEANNNPEPHNLQKDSGRNAQCYLPYRTSTIR